MGFRIFLLIGTQTVTGTVGISRPVATGRWECIGTWPVLVYKESNARFPLPIQSPMSDSSKQATEPKAQRVYIFRGEFDKMYNEIRYVFVGDKYVDDLAKQTPLTLVELLTSTATILYPELMGMVVWRIVENTTPLSVPDRATWKEMKNLLVDQESWSHAGRQYVESLGETVVTGSIPVLGRVDLSDVKNPLIAFFRFKG